MTQTWCTQYLEQTYLHTSYNHQLIITDFLKYNFLLLLCCFITSKLFSSRLHISGNTGIGVGVVEELRLNTYRRTKVVAMSSFKLKINRFED